MLSVVSALLASVLSEPFPLPPKHLLNRLSIWGYRLLYFPHSCPFRRAMPGSLPQYSWPRWEGAPWFQDRAFMRNTKVRLTTCIFFFYVIPTWFLFFLSWGWGCSCSYHCKEWRGILCIPILVEKILITVSSITLLRNSSGKTRKVCFFFFVFCH